MDLKLYRTCTGCGKTMELEKFHFSDKKRGYRHYRCPQCRLDHTRMKRREKIPIKTNFNYREKVPGSTY